MKRKAPPPGKNESAETHTFISADIGSFEKRAEERIEGSKTSTSNKVIELRQKIRSGFYENKDVLIQIVAKLLKDIKRFKDKE